MSSHELEGQTFPPPVRVLAPKDYWALCSVKGAYYLEDSSPIPQLRLSITAAQRDAFGWNLRDVLCLTIDEGIYYLERSKSGRGKRLLRFQWISPIAIPEWEEQLMTSRPDHNYRHLIHLYGHFGEDRIAIYRKAY